MDSAVAALLGSALGFLGSIIGSVIAPRLVRRREAADAVTRARAEALQRIVPELIAAGTEKMGPPNLEVTTRTMRLMTELNIWLREEDWQIATMVSTTFFPEEGVKVSVPALSVALPAWVSGHITASKAAEYVSSFTGQKFNKIF